MFQKLFAAAGFGGAKVDAQLDKSQYRPGELLTGKILIRGGSAEQDIAGLKVCLLTQVEIESDSGSRSENRVLARWQQHEKSLLKPDQQLTLPFSMQLPLETPITMLPGNPRVAPVWLGTELEIDYGVDANDRDYLRIEPVPAQANVLRAMENLGFVIKHADLEAGQARGNGFASSLGCYQEIEYRASGTRRLRLNEVEITFVLRADALGVLIELDRVGRSDTCVSRMYSLNATTSEIENDLYGLLC